MALGLGGNAVTVSLEVWRAMREKGAAIDLDPLSTGAALAGEIAERAGLGLERLRFAVVHPHSGHNYELRCWLCSCGIDPDADIEIVIVPPPLTADALGARADRRILRRRTVEHGGGGAGRRPHRHDQGGDLEIQSREGTRGRRGVGSAKPRGAGGPAEGALPRRRVVRLDKQS